LARPGEAALAYKVLIVEDSKAMRELVAATCEEAVADLGVVETANGLEAMKVLPRDHFDLIITDINMPNVNGLELIRYVKSNPDTRDTPLFIITTEASAQDRERGLALGANEYFTKPFQPEQLADAVRRYLESPP
jgi:two-component system chemotaxis response regulator CheY